MAKFEFDNRKEAGRGNATLKNGQTVHGVINAEPVTTYPKGFREHAENLFMLEINGPQGADRGSALLDKATAQRLGKTLLDWGIKSAALYCDDCAQERNWAHPLIRRIYGVCPLCGEGERELNTADKVMP